MIGIALFRNFHSIAENGLLVEIEFRKKKDFMIVYFKLNVPCVFVYELGQTVT